MSKKLEESREIASCRLGVGRTSQARIVRSSQMPKDFFSGQQSTKSISKTRSSEIYSPVDDKHIF